MARSFVVSVVVFALLAGWARAQEVSFLSIPEGYLAGTVPLGQNNSAEALAADPDDENSVYAAGTFGGARRIARVDLRDGAVTVVYNCPSTVSVGGFAVETADTLYVSDPMNDQLLVLRDENSDGDFDDPGEIRRLIEPILTSADFGWTGMAVRIVRSEANALGLPAGTVLFQSEDGYTTEGEILAVVDPLTSPVFQPSGGAYAGGFNYGGGLALDSAGRLLVASSFYPDTGKIWICEDLSGNGVIETGEANILADRVSPTTESAGLNTLAVDASDNFYTSVGWGGFGEPAISQIQSAAIPADPLHTTATLRTFAMLDSPFISALVFNTTARSFEPNAADGATMVIAAPDSFFGGVDYLLTLRPGPTTSEARRWTLY